MVKLANETSELRQRAKVLVWTSKNRHMLQVP